MASVTLHFRVSHEKREELKELAQHAHYLGLIEKPELTELFNLGMNLAFNECYKVYQEIKKGG